MRIFTLHLCILVTCAVLKDVASLEHKLTSLQKIGVENTKPIFCSKLSHRLLCYTLAMRREREGERQGGKPIFVLLCRCVSTLPFCRNAPWIPFVNHPATDTSLCHHLFSASGNHCAEALLERPSRILPDCLTNEEPKPILWGCCVLHITGPDKSPSLCSTQKEPRLFRIKTHGKLQFAFAFHKLSSAEPTNNSVCFLSVSLAGI